MQTTVGAGKDLRIQLPFCPRALAHKGLDVKDEVEENTRCQTGLSVWFY